MRVLRFVWHHLTLRHNWHWLWLSLAVVCLDQLSKFLVQLYMQEYQSIPLFPHLNLLYMRNTGAAFSMFSAMPATTFAAIAGVVSLCILWWLYRHQRGQALMAAGLCLIMGGAIGNAIDRITRGYVVDFVDFHIGNWHFAAFNLADSAITIGAACLLLDAVLDYFKQRGQH